jgi:hypothetical protein
MVTARVDLTVYIYFHLNQIVLFHLHLYMQVKFCCFIDTALFLLLI